MKYKTLLFDADGTLFDFHKGEGVAIRQTFAAFDIDADDQMVAEYSAINDSLWKKLELGEIEKSVLFYRRFELFFERYGFIRDAREMGKTYAENLSKQIFLFEGAEELCEKLSSLADMYIVTNGIEFVQKSRYAKSGLDKYFKGIFISGEIGHEKPSVDFFKHIERSIPDFDKDGAIIVGDSLSADIKGGIAYGIDTCWYNPAGKTAPDGMKITNTSQNFEEVYRFITA